MNVLKLTVRGEARNGTRARFYPIGDPHLDLKTTRARTLKRYIAHIAADEYGFAVCVGDIFNGSLPGHKYFSAKALKGTIAQNTDEYVNLMLAAAVEVFAPLVDAGVPVVFLQGNHDKWVKGVNLVKLLVEQLKARKPGATVLYGGGEALIHIRVGHGSSPSQVWTMHAHHGAGGGYTVGGKQNRFQNTAAHVADADIFVRGHVHDQTARVVAKYRLDQLGRFRKRQVAYVTTCAFNTERLEGIVDYAGEMALPPVDEGIVYLELVNPLNKGEEDVRSHSGKMLRIEFEV